tara:strand:+ start:89 stop:358 length:270 start_codon:yes stop_codon:yes gene_type:complete
MIGCASYMIQYSPWDAYHYICMDCLYLFHSYRGFGFGQELFDRIKEGAEKINIKKIQWQTSNFNIRVIKFYNQTGGQSKSKVRYFLGII